ncbi:ribose 5-phosphate isomerase A [Bacillus sp. 03113]|uniref:ribose 5-phosphate isomerase A n=1 Tax=Bacillus sp. 03113 TaxID=2578211 RepID=UPI0011434262|nr:ribose 5-phosphate isomerase A [Bacillus sp. 03113]
MDKKKNCAKEALAYINNYSIVGLGGGSTISYLIDFIKEKELQVKVVTPSFKTKMLCLQNGLDVLHTSFVDHVDVAFDGCDEVDEQLFALKSGGGIHTKEKLIASMADDYILLVDDTKFVKALTFGQPVVLEILEESLAYVTKAVTKLGGEPVTRQSTAKDGATISDNGNLLLDVHFQAGKDIEKLQGSLKRICGVVDTSLFTKEVTKVLVASDDEVKVFEKNK